MPTSESLFCAYCGVRRTPVLQPPVARQKFVEELPFDALSALRVHTPLANGGLVLGVVKEHLFRGKKKFSKFARIKTVTAHATVLDAGP
jgi:hypothetical protein